jgi:hypothetical protein
MIRPIFRTAALASVLLAASAAQAQGPQQDRMACQLACRMGYDRCETDRCRKPPLPAPPPPGYAACHITICQPQQDRCLAECRKRYPKRWWEFGTKD